MFPAGSTGLPPASLSKINQYLQQGQFNEAVALLTTHAPEAVPQVWHEPLRELLKRFSPDAFDANPDLLYWQSILLAQTNSEQATTQLLRAILLYRNHGAINRAAACYFELIRIYQQREDFRTAYLYVREAEEVLRQIPELAIEARLYLRLAELSPDLGRLREGIDYALRALAGFRQSEELYHQFKTHILLSILYRQVGDYHAAEAQLEMGRRLQQAGRLDEEAYVRVLNSAAHLAWYRGDLVQAIQQAETLAIQVRKVGSPKFQVYSALLLGNLYRAQGAFATAQRWYSETRTLVDQAALRLYRPWVDLNEGWLYVLGGDYIAARKLIHQALTTPDRGQLMSFTVHLALLNLLEAHYTVAENLLRSTQLFYQKSGDELAIAVINLYLAYALQMTSRPVEAQTYLQAGLDWFAEHHIWSFPYWWHPQLVAQICGLALRLDVQVALVEHMVVHHIGAVARPVLLPLLQAAEPCIVHRAQTVLTLLAEHDGDWLHWLTTIPDEPVRQALEKLLREDVLRKEKLPELKRTLTTAQQRDKPNPVLIAVFGLYLQGANLKTIAAQLQRAPASIRNYISTIYQIFDLPSDGYASLRERRQQLRNLARQRGFLGAQPNPRERF
ncbi:MAG: hypothetical protein KF832_06385 [Caldilineaceae bacterium]|nr:hypothetical protein [Caldilineaceae bacterium]